MAKTATGSRMDTIVKFVLVFFVALLSFSVGTFVGKQVSDSDHRRVALEEDYGGAHRDVASESVDTKEDSGKVREEDIANLTEEFVASEKKEMAEAHHNEAEKAKDQKDAATHKVEAATKDGYAKATNKSEHKEEAKHETAKAEHKTDKAEEYKKVATMTEKAEAEINGHKVDRSPTAARVANGQAPAADPKEVRKPDTVLPSVATSAVGKYTVQVASYADEQEAKNHAAELRAKGWNAFYLPAEISNRTWYRVSVGLFTTLKSANDFKTELSKEAKVQAAIVQKIIK